MVNAKPQLEVSQKTPMVHRLILVAALVLGSVPLPANAGDCGDAKDAYDQAVSDVNAALIRYARCVRDSGGEDDCTAEFGRLKNAQAELEDAVSNIESAC